MQKQVRFKIKGMQRDLSASAFNSEYAYENKNIRVMPTDESTLLSLVNEKGNKLVNAEGVGDTVYVTPVGQALINNELVLFTAGESTSKVITNIPASSQSFADIPATSLDITISNDSDDRIYKFWFDGGVLKGKTLYSGNLGFEYSSPIEAISFYENEGIRKIYWTDGLNQPRVINIAASEEVINKWNPSSFDFTRKLKLEEIVTIERNMVSGGVFAPGVIQYAFTYFDKYSQETNIFQTSPLFYVSYNNRGASPEDKVGNSFNIIIDSVDKSFDYVRVYSIHRTSINATPTVRRVVDLAPPKGESAFTVSSYETQSPLASTQVFNILQGKYVNLSTIPGDRLGDSVIWILEGNKYKYLKLANGDYALIEPTRVLRVTLTNDINIHLTYGDGTKSLTVYRFGKGRVSFTDNGTSGDVIDPTELLYVGGEEVIFGTMAQKDNTLFLGDITINRKMIPSKIRDFFKGKSVKFMTETINTNYLTSPEPTGLYPYDNQLKYNSSQIKTFKYLETYRLGIQFQHTSGKWSEPIWMNDIRNNVSSQVSYTRQGNIVVPVAKYELTDLSIITNLITEGYIKARPVVVYPSLSERECVCQGILCPTMFNVSDRNTNSPFVQSSWFTRPNPPFDYEKSFRYKPQGTSYVPDLADRDNPRQGIASVNSRAGTMFNGYSILTGYDFDKGEAIDIKVDNVNKGTILTYKHLGSIPSNNSREAEIQCIHKGRSDKEVVYVDRNNSEDIISTYVSKYSDRFYVDQSIFTMHSPDLEFDTSVRSIDTSGLKLRIIGIVPFTSAASDIDIQTSTLPNNYKGSGEVAPGFYKEAMGSNNISRFGCRGIASGAFWFDEISDPVDSYSNADKLPTAFVVYPFHRNGSLNNTAVATEGVKTAMLSRKKMSTLRYSYNTYYLNTDKIWYAYRGDSMIGTNTGISGVTVFDSNEVSVIKLPAPVNSGLDSFNYYGNIDKVITSSANEDSEGGYPIMVAGSKKLYQSRHEQYIGMYSSVHNVRETSGGYTEVTKTYTSNDPVVMKYKSTPHAVMALNYTTQHDQRILPTLNDGNIKESPTGVWAANYAGLVFDNNKRLYWDKKDWTRSISQDVIDIQFGTSINGSADGYGPEYGFLWLGELYNDNVPNRFGGQSEEAFENNSWIPCGESVNLVTTDSVFNPITIVWKEGDTYYQRYDHIKTYPFTLEDQNAITDIASFMCETRINLDGRYDRNRGQLSNFTVNPTNFNLLNPVYSQENDFFVYRTINPNKINLDNFANSITWTKTKTAGELVDTWTNITLSSTLDLDGDKGKVRSLKRFNNEIVAFQDRGISNILFNSRTQLSTNDGVPIEIANSGKVDGKRYLSDRIGCSNKWSICETPAGLYFIDDISKGIFLFNGQLDNISDRLGFHSWINSRSTSIKQWNPVDFEGFVTYYDKVNGDVFFITKNECLAYSEPLGQFSSFYSYENTAYMINLDDRAIQFSTVQGGEQYKIWLHNEGDYNMYFNRFEPFYTTIIANPEPTTDKVFDVVEFRADTWKGSNLLSTTTMDTLYTWNEYQSGKSYLTQANGRPSPLKKKFRIWRANIPRDKSNNRDRMRNPWLYIKLATEKVNTNKTLLHDMVIQYFN